MQLLVIECQRLTFSPTQWRPCENVSCVYCRQIYPYLVVNDACLMESRREERVFQLLRMLNLLLSKQKA